MPRPAGGSERRRSPARAPCWSATAPPSTSYPGDVVMAVFGVPLLHEDDALRAVRAAAELRRTHPRRTRIGVATGEVIAERGSRRAPPAAGDAVNDAKRLQEQAGPDEIAVDAATRRLVRESVAFEPGPGESFLVGSLHAGDTRGRAFTSPLIGRDHQLRALETAFDAATCEPRLPPRDRAGNRGRREVAARGGVHRLAGRRGDRAPRPLPPLRRGDHLLAAQRGGARPRRRRPAAARPRRCATRWRRSSRATRRRISSRTCSREAVGLGDAGGYPAEKIFWAARRLFELLAERRPVVVVLDDLQWAEATFLDLVEHVADLTRDAPVLLLCLARPELLDSAPRLGRREAERHLDPARAAEPGGQPRAGGQPRGGAHAGRGRAHRGRHARGIRCSRRSCSRC